MDTQTGTNKAEHRRHTRTLIGSLDQRAAFRAFATSAERGRNGPLAKNNAGQAAMSHANKFQPSLSIAKLKRARGISLPSSPVQGQENFEESQGSLENERVQSPTNLLSPSSKPYVQNMVIRF